MQRKMVSHRGSVQNMEEVPDDLKQLYRTSFEIKQKAQMDLAIGRSPFIDQTQSYNVFVANPTDSILTSIQMYAWKNRVKTGQYYLRREATNKAMAFTAEKSSSPKTTSIQPKPEERSAFGGSAKSGHKSATSDNNKSENKDKKASSEEELQLCRINDPDCAACQV